MKQKINTRTMTAISMLCAIAFVLTWLTKQLPPIFPASPFLELDGKDIVIIIGGFLYGPIAVALMSVVNPLLEFVTFSSTGVIGLLMNIVSSCAFAFPVVFIYNKKRTITGAAVGLAVGCITVTAVMVLWNYFLVPFYQDIPAEFSEDGKIVRWMTQKEVRQEIKGMLIPVFMPFNFIKSILNAAFTMIIYRPVKAALIKSRLMPKPEAMVRRGKVNVGVLAASLFVIITCVLWILVLQGVI